MMLHIERTEDEIEEQIELALEELGSGNDSYNIGYNRGVRETLSWILSETDLKPIDKD